MPKKAKKENIRFNQFRNSRTKVTPDKNKPEEWYWKTQSQTAIAGSDALGNAGFEVSFEHVPSTRMVTFKAFISSFQENYISDWASETVFGRPDAIHMYKNTGRSISMSLKIPAATLSEGFDNLANVSTLVKFLYPLYQDVQGAQTIAQSPLVRLKVMNLIGAHRHNATAWTSIGDEKISDPGNDASSGAWGPIGANYDTVVSADKNSWGDGALGIIRDLAISHNLDNPEIGVFEMATGTILPKMIEITFSFSVIHETPLGWRAGPRGRAYFSNQAFPYGVRDSSMDQYKGRAQAPTGPNSPPLEYENRGDTPDTNDAARPEPASEASKKNRRSRMERVSQGIVSRKEERKSWREYDKMAKTITDLGGTGAHDPPSYMVPIGKK